MSPGTSRSRRAKEIPAAAQPASLPPEGQPALGRLLSERVFPLVWTLVATYLLVANIGGPPLTNDEAIYIRWVGLPWNELLATLRADNYPPAYFALVKFWTEFRGTSEGSARLLSVPFAIGVLLTLGMWTQRSFGTAVGRATWIALGLSPLLLLCGRLLKYYSLLQLLMVGSSLLAFRIVEDCVAEDRRQRTASTRHRVAVAAWALINGAMLWVHYAGFVVIGAQALWALGRWWVAGRVRAEREGAAAGIPWTLVIGFVAAGVAFLPWVPSLWSRVAADAGVEGFTRADENTALRLVASVGYSGYAFLFGHTLEIATRWKVWVLGALVGYGLLMLGLAPRRATAEEGSPAAANAGPGRWAWDLRILYLGYLALAIGTGVYVLLAKFSPRLPLLAYSERLGLVLPFVIVIGACGFVRLPGWARWCSIVALGIPTMTSVFGLLGARENNMWDMRIPWRSIQTTVAAGERPSLVVVDSMTLGSQTWYYLRPVSDGFIETRGYAERGVKPSALAEEIAKTEARTVYYVRSARDTSIGQFASALQAELEKSLGEGGIHRYLVEPPETQRLKAWLRRGTNTPTLEAKLVMLEYRRGADAAPAQR